MAARGKQEENSHLRRFKEKFVGFPDGDIIPSEHPDFLVDTPSECIGIEHTRNIRGDLGAEEHAEAKTLFYAKKDYESKELPPVHVTVLWNLLEHPTPGRAQQDLGAELSSFVESHLPMPNSLISVRYGEHQDWKSLPQGVNSLYIDRQEYLTENTWVSLRSGGVPTLGPLDLQRIISKKEGLIVSYRQKCTQVWLLIVANGFEPSTHCDLSPEITEFRFVTDFDRAFFLHYLKGLVVELKIRDKSTPGSCIVPKT